MWILGVLIGKGIFERISIDCKINKTIIRQLCQQPIHIHDVYSLDKKVNNHRFSCIQVGKVLSIMKEHNICF